MDIKVNSVLLKNASLFYSLRILKYRFQILQCIFRIRVFLAHIVEASGLDEYKIQVIIIQIIKNNEVQTASQ